VHSSNGQAGTARPAMVLRILVVSVGSFAVGTGTFVVTGVLTDIAEDLSVSVANPMCGFFRLGAWRAVGVDCPFDG
jgi:hypothetical protein